jgi:hypothetical protein
MVVSGGWVEVSELVAWLAFSACNDFNSAVYSLAKFLNKAIVNFVRNLNYILRMSTFDSSGCLLEGGGWSGVLALYSIIFINCDFFGIGIFKKISCLK